MVDGKYIANPTYTEARASKLNIIVAGSEQGIVMVEAGAQQVSEEEVLGALEHRPRSLQEDHRGAEAAGRGGRQDQEGLHAEGNRRRNCCAAIDKKVRAELTDALNTKKYEKLESYARVDALHDRVVEEAAEEKKDEADKLFDILKERIFRDEMLEARRRPDGREFDEIRAIWGEAGVLPRTHGSALFTRGETQALVTVTLGTKDDEQRVELLEPGESFKRFMLHYNFPPFSVGEVGLHARTRPPRNRPRRSGRARGERGASGRRRSSPTRCAWSATFWNRTVRVRWRRSAARAWR